MAEGNSGADIHRILAAVKSSEVVEDRVQLFTDLGNLSLKEASESDHASVMNCLVSQISTYWETFTCLDVTQCMLNRSILQVALKNIDFNLPSCLLQTLILGVKASIWSGKHLQMTLLSTEESQEDEHSSVFYQLLLEILRFSASTFSALLKFTDISNKELMNNVEIFTIEVLNLTKDSISEAKKIQSFGSEILKATHTVIDVVVKLCKVRSELINWEACDEKQSRFDKPIHVVHAINITKYTIEKLSQIGVLAANDGGSLVNILSISWKGVVSLLQIGGGHLTEVDIANIVVSLLVLIAEPLKCAAEVWSSSLNETISVTEAKRIFVPVKFYLINAVKICSLYPHQTYTVYREIAHCILTITSFWILANNENLLKNASAVIAELLEETTLDLVLSLLISDKLKLEQKLEVMEWLFVNEDSHSGLDCPTLAACNFTLVNKIFLSSCEDISRSRVLMLGRVVLFINFLKYSLKLDEDVKVAITQKLNWFLDVLVEEDVYSCMLVLQLPSLSGSGKTAELVWQPMFTLLLQAFKTFMIVISSSTAWSELQSFLLENFFHPHFLCWEIVMQCWCFVLQYAETQMANNIISKLCSLLKLLGSSDSVFLPHSSFRKLTRSFCLLLTCCEKSVVEEVFMSIVGDRRSHLSQILCLALFIEGFSLDLLSDEFRKTSIQTIISDYFDFIDNFNEASLTACSSSLFGIPVFILSASLQSSLQSIKERLPEIDARAIKFLVSISSNYKSTVDKEIKDHSLRLFGEILVIISYLEHLYKSNDIEQAIIQIENIFITEPPVLLYKCKPHLAQFLTGLVHMEFSESDDGDAKSRAAWELFHLILTERHWAFTHLALTAFGYFAAHTTCCQLWRFLPPDAALSYDIISGTETTKERFYAELREFLNKQNALLTVAPSPEQLELLRREGLMLKQMIHNISVNAERRDGCENMEIDDKNQLNSMEVDDMNQTNKKRKLPAGISKGVELLKNGLKIIGDGLSEWQLNQFETNELHVKYSAQFSRLEDAITHFEELAGSGEVCLSPIQSNLRG
ncbi:hypothetical protein MtrunA17_Chr1g0196651 [Medicago truncatula]|uniref:Uncharacterized protein n=1 Tax=Medicago truncatula TaxID=3880 RepID=A0A396JSC8_MEDTR|nr:hypothetical protein MtrunA17_Chr1g0196651 [Medicago truncatula]